MDQLVDGGLIVVGLTFQPLVVGGELVDLVLQSFLSKRVEWLDQLCIGSLGGEIFLDGAQDTEGLEDLWLLRNQEGHNGVEVLQIFEHLILLRFAGGDTRILVVDLGTGVDACLSHGYNLILHCST